MLIKIKNSPKTQAEKRANHWYTQEGQAQREDAIDLQKDMQGGLSDMMMTPESEGIHRIDGVEVNSVDSQISPFLPPITLRLEDGSEIDYLSHQKAFQRAFHANLAKFVLLGGGVGAGKSVAALVQVIWELWIYPDNFGLILRKTYPELRISAMKDFETVLPNWMKMESNRQEHFVKVMNFQGYQALDAEGPMSKREELEFLESVDGLSEVRFASFEGTGDALSKFRSANLGFYLIEQAEEASLEIYDALLERLRRPRASRRGYFVSNAEGYDWLWEIFYADSPTKRPDHEVIGALTTDNDSLPDDYVEAMRSNFTEEKMKQKMEGDIKVHPLTIFTEFSKQVHVIPHVDPDEFVMQEINQFEIDKARGDTKADPYEQLWEKGMGFDWGVRNASVALSGARLPTGELYVYDEYYEKSDQNTVELIIPELLKRIRHEHTILVIDPSSKQRDGEQSSVFLRFHDGGIPFIPADRAAAPGAVVAAIDMIKDYLKFDQTRRHPFTGKKGSPRLIISDACPNLIEEMRIYQWEQQKTGIGHSQPPQVPRNWRDDTIAALRYLMTYMPEARPTPGPHAIPKNRRGPDISEHIRLNPDVEGGFEMSIEKMVEDSLKMPTRAQMTRRKVT